MKTTRTRSFYLLLLILVFSGVACTSNENEEKDSRSIKFKKMEKSVTPLEVVRFFSSTSVVSITDPIINQPII